MVAAFDGGAVTSDAGGLLLGATDRAIGLVGRAGKERARLDRLIRDLSSERTQRASQMDLQKYAVASHRESSRP